jgi:hypothetical protein
MRPEDFTGDMRDSFEAHSQLFWYNANRDQPKFPKFLAQAEAERTPEAIQARELFFQARRKWKAAEPARNIVQIYDQAIPIWLGVLERFPEHRKHREVQEFTYRHQMKYLDLVVDRRNAQRLTMIKMEDLLYQRQLDLKQLLLVADWLAQGAQRPAGQGSWLPPGHLLTPGRLLEPPKGPFDRFILPETFQRVRGIPDTDDFN